MSPAPRFSVVLVGGGEADRARLAPHAEGAELLVASDQQAGLEAAEGDVVAFLRHDARPLPGWLARYRAAFAEAELASAAGRVFPQLAPGCSDWARVVMHDNFGPFERFDLGHFDRQVRPQDRGFLPTDNFAVRRQVVLDYGGFDQGESLLRLQLEGGEVVRYLPSATVQRPIPADFPLEQRFGPWWEEHGRRQVRVAGPTKGFARFKERWRAQRKSRRYQQRMADWPVQSAPWTTLAAKHHLHRGRALELKG